MKFSDLADAIKADHGWTRAAIESILEWLDAHPDRVPGRTMTASEFGNYNTEAAGTYGDGFRAGFERAGGEVVPDPEPTNAEKWVKFCSSKMGLDLDPWQANVLDKAGVKAPGGDDE